MYGNYIKPNFMTNTTAPTFGSTNNGNGPFASKTQFFGKTNTPGFAPNAPTSTFGQSGASAPMFSSLQPTNIFQTPNTSTFNAGPSTQSGFGSNLFGQQQQQPSTSSMFGSTNAFGQNKTTFGFGASQNQSGLFGQQSQQQPGSSLFQSNTSNLFGSPNAFGGQTQSGTVVKFSPVTGTDTMQKNGVAQSISTKHHCITCMKEYENKSLEELRFEDYSCNRKGPQQQTGFAATPFGAPATNQPPSLFGQTDNKSGFGQTSSFGQPPTFGQSTGGFGMSNQSAPSLFGKPTGFGTPTSNTNSFGFNPAPSNVNPFSANQTSKPFSQPLFGSNTSQQQQTAFGTGVFGQTSTQNTSTNMFQKAAQPSTGFNTGQSGFSFNQPSMAQSSNLFQVSKPNTSFSIFGQATTGTSAFGQTSQPAFGSSFGKPITSSFGQPAQTGFGSSLGGVQQPLFGNTTSKPSSVFGNTTSGTNLYTSNVFQQAPTSFSLPVGQQQQQQQQFPPEPSDDMRNISVLATDSFPDGPHIYGLEPMLPESSSSKSTTNPKDLKRFLDSSKKRDDFLHTRSKIKVNLPKIKRGNNFNREFFDANQALRSSHKCLVIRKFNENPNTVYNKFNNELLEEAAECLKAENNLSESVSDFPTPKSSTDKTESVEKLVEKDPKKVALRLQFDSPSPDSFDEAPKVNKSTLTFDEASFQPFSSTRRSFGIPDDESAVHELDVEVPSSTATSQTEGNDNPAGVTLTRPEYYMYPALTDLHQYIDENGECIVQGLTIGRKGYGNVFFPDPIDISNMNFDEIVHFRHREIIIYPDDSKRPPVGEGLNRRAQITLDKIFPREQGTDKYITDVDEITQSNFFDNLMIVTQKHKCKFVDYRPATGSWVFKVKHFSKYSFTDSDEEECEISSEVAMLKKKENALKKIEEVEEFSNIGLGGQFPAKAVVPEVVVSESDSQVVDDALLNFWPEEYYPFKEEEFRSKSFVQVLKSALFQPEEVDPEILPSQDVHLQEYPVEWEVTSVPRVHPLSTLSSTLADEFMKKQRCYIDLGLFKGNSYKVGWLRGGKFYRSEEVLMDASVTNALLECQIQTTKSSYDSMMPNLEEMLKITLEESVFTFDIQNVPTLTIKENCQYLKKQTELFNKHVRTERLGGKKQYLCAVWNLCTALWGEGDNSPYSRRQYLSDWLERFSYSLADDPIEIGAEIKAAEHIFTLLSFHRIKEAADFAMKNNMNALSLLISQLSGNERFKAWLKKYIDSYLWQTDVVLDPFKKIYLLLAGIPIDEGINTCENIDWKRSFGLHLWYISPPAAPIDVAVNLYQTAFDTSQYAVKPVPPYYSSDFDPPDYDLLYHILMLYTSCTYQLCYVLHPATHTDKLMDYRISWVLLQLFLSLKVGLIKDGEANNLHVTFSNQLEDQGHWKWAIFVLLFLKDNLVKKNLVTKILERNLLPHNDTLAIEKELVQVFKMPATWIHEVKAYVAINFGSPYEYFQHFLCMKDWQQANSTFVEHILPQLFINEQYDYLKNFIIKLEPGSHTLLNWNTQGGMFKEFLDLQDLVFNSDELNLISTKFNLVCRKINSFPVQNGEQRLCIAELSRKCALLFKFLFKKLDSQMFQARFIDIFEHLVMPPDYMHYEIFFLISQYVYYDSMN